MTDEPPTKRKCLGADCENDAGSLQCPTCMKLGIKDSFFCSQDCFKKNWVSLILPGGGGEDDSKHSVLPRLPTIASCATYDVDSSRSRLLTAISLFLGHPQVNA